MGAEGEAGTPSSQDLGSSRLSVKAFSFLRILARVSALAPPFMAMCHVFLEQIATVNGVHLSNLGQRLETIMPPELPALQYK